MEVLRRFFITYLLYIGIIEIHPNLEFGVKEEGGVVFAVVRDNAHQLMLGILSPSLFANLMENIRQT